MSLDLRALLAPASIAIVGASESPDSWAPEIAPNVLVERMAAGQEVLIGAIVDDRFGALVTVRPEGSLAETWHEAFVPAPLTRKQAHAYVASQAERCGLDPSRHDLRALVRAVEAIARAAHDLRGRLTSLEANPLLVAERGALAVDALTEARFSA